MREAYLDNSATTRCFPEVVELMNKIYLEEYGNPSSMHHKGVEAEKHITEAKKRLAQILKVNERNLIFTSCGTESDNIAIIGGALANMRRGRHLVTSMIEHPAVLESMRYLESQGFEVTYLPVDEYGIVSPDLVEEAVRDDTILVSIMHTNNEIGAVEPIREIAKAHPGDRKAHWRQKSVRSLSCGRGAGLRQSTDLSQEVGRRPALRERPQDPCSQGNRIFVYRG